MTNHPQRGTNNDQRSWMRIKSSAGRTAFFCFISIKISNLLKHQNSEGHEERTYRHPETDGAEGVLVDGGLSGTHGVGTHVDDIVLLDVIYGRREHVLAAEVNG